VWAVVEVKVVVEVVAYRDGDDQREAQAMG
jgi:hypothetical protein